MNTVMRTLGGSVGSQIGASVIAATVVGSALPTEHGFTVAFLVAGAACALATLASLAVPRPVRRAAGTLVADTAWMGYYRTILAAVDGSADAAAALRHAATLARDQHAQLIVLTVVPAAPPAVATRARSHPRPRTTTAPTRGSCATPSTRCRPTSACTRGSRAGARPGASSRSPMRSAPTSSSWAATATAACTTR